MDRNPKRSPASNDIGLLVRSDWSVGPRTAAWDRLWRLMLGGIRAQPIAGVREQREMPVDG